jgi:hypothetical protein
MPLERFFAVEIQQGSACLHCELWSWSERQQVLASESAGIILFSRLKKSSVIRSQVASEMHTAWPEMTTGNAAAARAGAGTGGRGTPAEGAGLPREGESDSDGPVEVGAGLARSCEPAPDAGVGAVGGTGRLDASVRGERGDTWPLEAGGGSAGSGGSTAAVFSAGAAAAAAFPGGIGRGLRGFADGLRLAVLLAASEEVGMASDSPKEVDEEGVEEPEEVKVAGLAGLVGRAWPMAGTAREPAAHVVVAAGGESTEVLPPEEEVGGGAVAA